VNSTVHKSNVSETDTEGLVVLTSFRSISK